MRKATRRARYLLLGCATLAFSMPVHAGEVWEGKWLEARSPNFVVISALRKRTTVQLVQELEDFRTLVGAVTNASVLEERVPTRVYVFKRAEPDLGLKGGIAGYLIPEMRANYAAARIVDGLPLSHVLQHEYTHFLIRNQDGQAYPKWYDEGLAEFLGTVDLRGGRFTLGDAAPGRLLTLSVPGAWMPYSRVVDDSRLTDLSPRENGYFYAESWALVHYLTWGKPDFNFSAGLKEYLAEREHGIAAVPAFEKAFGEDTAKLGKVIRGYLDHGHYRRGELSNPFDPAAIATRQLALDEVAAQLAQLCMATASCDDPDRYVDAALAANPDNATALVIRADRYKAAGKFAEAEALYPKAIELEPDNDLHHLDFGEYWLTRATGTYDHEARKSFFSKARQEFVQADKLNDHNPETLAIYGNSFAQEGNDPAKGLPTLEYAHSLLPSNPQIKLMLAQMYITVGRKGDARPLLNAVIAWEHDEDGAAAARKLLAAIDGTGTSVETAPHSQTPGEQ